MLRPRRDPFAVTDISNLQLEQIASPQLAVDTEIEERQFPHSVEDLKPNADSPDLLKFQWRFLTNKFSLVSRCRNKPNSKLIHGRLLKFEEP